CSRSALPVGSSRRPAHAIRWVGCSILTLRPISDQGDGVSAGVPVVASEHAPHFLERHVVTPYELRPLAIGELLDRVFSLYRRHLSTFVGIMAVPALASLKMALGTLVLQHQAGLVSQPGFPGRSRFGTPPPDISPQQLITFVSGMLILVF